MDKKVISNFYFDSYNIEDIDFQLNQNFDGSEVDLKIDTEINISIRSGENEGITAIKLLLWDEENSDNYPFKLSATIKGYFSADKDMDRERFEEMCKYNGAAILFPFLRSAVSDITKVANIRTLNLPLINIKKLIDERND